MFRHILIPTDGSELAEKAICYGVELAKEQAAKITAVVVTRPFLIVTLEPGMLAGTPATYAKHVAERTRKYLDVAAASCRSEARPSRHSRTAKSPCLYIAKSDEVQDLCLDLPAWNFLVAPPSKDRVAFDSLTKARGSGAEWYLVTHRSLEQPRSLLAPRTRRLEGIAL
jgi:hypothetical protein